MGRAASVAYVRQLRDELGMNIDQFAAHVGISKRTVNRLEAGESVAISSIRAVAQACKVKVADLLGDAVLDDLPVKREREWAAGSFQFKHKEYLQNVRNRLGSIKLLGIGEVPLEKVYQEPIFHSDSSGTVCGISNIFGRGAYVYGGSGTGKTALVRHIACSLCDPTPNAVRDKLGDVLPIPLLMSDLMELVPADFSFDSLLKVFALSPFADWHLTVGEIVALLKAGMAVLLVDGLVDYYSTEAKRVATWDYFQKDLAALGVNPAHVLVTSRESSPASSRDFDGYRLTFSPELSVSLLGSIQSCEPESESVASQLKYKDCVRYVRDVRNSHLYGNPHLVSLLPSIASQPPTAINAWWYAIWRRFLGAPRYRGNGFHFDGDECLFWMSQLAFVAHMDCCNGSYTVSSTELRSRFHTIYNNFPPVNRGVIEDFEVIFDYVKYRSGLLEEYLPGCWRFGVPGSREYLAAYYLAYRASNVNLMNSAISEIEACAACLDWHSVVVHVFDMLNTIELRSVFFRLANCLFTKSKLATSTELALLRKSLLKMVPLPDLDNS